MGRKAIALSLDEEINDKYKEHYKKHSIILSRKVEKFMEEKIKKKGEKC